MFETILYARHKSHTLPGISHLCFEIVINDMNVDILHWCFAGYHNNTLSSNQILQIFRMPGLSVNFLIQFNVI